MTNQIPLINIIRAFSALNNRPKDVSFIEKYRYGWKWNQEQKKKKDKEQRRKDMMYFTLGAIVFIALMFYSGQA